MEAARYVRYVKHAVAYSPSENVRPTTFLFACHWFCSVLAVLFAVLLCGAALSFPGLRERLNEVFLHVHPSVAVFLWLAAVNQIGYVLVCLKKERYKLFTVPDFTSYGIALLVSVVLPSVLLTAVLPMFSIAASIFIGSILAYVISAMMFAVITLVNKH